MKGFFSFMFLLYKFIDNFQQTYNLGHNDTTGPLMLAQSESSKVDIDLIVKICMKKHKVVPIVLTKIIE